MLKIIVGIGLVISLMGCADEDTENPEEGQETSELVDQVEEEDIESVEAEDESEELEEDSTDVEAVTYQIDYRYDEIEISLDMHIGPIVREGELAVLPISIDTEDEVSMQFSNLFTGGVSTGEGIDQSQGFNIRMIDPVSSTVAHTAILPTESNLTGAVHTLTGEGVRQNQEEISPDNTVRFYAVFKAPEGDEAHVLLRLMDIFDHVPVVDREGSSIPDFSEVEESLSEEELAEANGVIEEAADRLVIPSVDEIIQMQMNENDLEPFQGNISDHLVARTASIETFREILQTSISRIDEVDQSTLILSSDVLFEFDSSELMAEADEELNAAISELSGIEGGELEIVGHTDDEHTEEYNQQLSEERAESVRDRLDTLMDLAVFDEVIVRGDSFREPVADNNSEEGRAQNRRVELLFTPSTELIETEEVEIGLPEAMGEEVTYPDSVETRFGEVEIISLRQVDDLLVGRLRVTNEEASLDIYSALTSFGSGARGYYNPDLVGYSQFTAYAPTLISGNYRYYPLDYYQEPLAGTLVDSQLQEAEDEPYIIPLSERNLPLNVRQYEATIIWPMINQDEVTVDLSHSEKIIDIIPEQFIDQTSPWRILDVPVERE